MARGSLHILLALTVVVCSAYSQEAQLSSDRSAELLTQYCFDCHGDGDEPEAGFSVSALVQSGFRIEDDHQWKNLLEAIETGFMPPGGSGMTADERTELRKLLETRIPKPTAIEPVARRLTRLEYNNALRDLLKLDRDVVVLHERAPISRTYYAKHSERSLGTSFRIDSTAFEAKKKAVFQRVGLPPDKKAESGFTNDVEVLTFDAERVQQYLELATALVRDEASIRRSRVLRRHLATPGSVTLSHVVVLMTAWALMFGLMVKGHQRSTAIGLLLLVTAVTLSQLTVDFRGDCELGAIIVAIWLIALSLASSSQNGPKQLLMAAALGGILAAVYTYCGIDGAAATFAFASVVVVVNWEPSDTVRWRTTWWQMARKLLPLSIPLIALLAWDVAAKNSVPFLALELRTIAAFDRPGFLEEWSAAIGLIAVTGLIASVSLAIRARTHRFGAGCSVAIGIAAVLTCLAIPQQEGRLIAALHQPVSKSSVDQIAHKRIRTLAEVAFRASTDDGDSTQPLLEAYDEARKAGEGFREAMSRATIACLVSPRMLFRVDSASKGHAAGLELANRLSFFLWKTAPDDQLRDAALSGRLLTDAGLRGEVVRMLSDKRTKEFSEDFCTQWLQLGRLQSARPDAETFPEYYPDDDDENGGLALPMLIEPILLFEEVLRSDQSILTLIEADHTFVNRDLAALYEVTDLIPGPLKNDPEWEEGDLWVRVATDNSQRGGITTMAGPLTLTSFSQRTSPVRRGIWILDVLMNRPPREPNAAASFKREEPIPGETMREKLTRHREDTACASCHDLIDPAGFAFEDFDPIGRERAQDNGRPIDSSGTLATGESFTRVNEFKGVVMKRKESFVRGFCEKLMTYAIGRSLTGQDRLWISHMVEELRQHDYRFSKVVELIVLSPQFRCSAEVL